MPRSIGRRPLPLSQVGDQLGRGGGPPALLVGPVGDVHQVGNIARGAGRSGAPHAMAVNETILAFVTGGTDPDGTGVTGGTGEGGGPGMGTVLSWTTEVVLEAPDKRRVQADAVLRAPEYDLPVLLVEVGRATEAPHILAAKFERYAAFFAHRVKVADPDSHAGSTKLVPAWQLAYGAPVRTGYPPVVVVFTGGSDTVLRNRMKVVRDLARPYWEGDSRYEGFTDYRSAIPVVVTTVDRLRQHGELRARYAGMSEPLRSRIIALIEDRQRRQCDRDQQPPQGSSG